MYILREVTNILMKMVRRTYIVVLLLLSYVSYGQNEAEMSKAIAEYLSEIPDIYINSIVTDSLDNIWIGTKENGLIEVTPEGFKGFNKANSPLLDNNITAISIDKQGNKWIATDQGGLAYFDGEQWKIFTQENSGLPSNTILTVRCTDEGVWIGTYFAGLSFYDGNQWDTYNIDNSPLLSNKVMAINEDQNKVLWVGTMGGGLYSLDPKGVWKIYTIYDSQLPSNFIYDIQIDPENNKWIATGGQGIGVYNDEYWITFNKDNSKLNDNNIHKIYITKKGNKWISTYRKGVVFFNGEDWTIYDNHNSDIPDDVVTSIDYRYPNTVLFGMQRYGLIAIEDTLSVKNPGYASKFTEVKSTSIMHGQITQSHFIDMEIPSSENNKVSVLASSQETDHRITPNTTILNKTNVPVLIKPNYIFDFHLGTTLFRGDLDVRDEALLLGNFGFSLEKNVMIRKKFLGNILFDMDFGQLTGAKRDNYFKNNYKELKLQFRFITGNRNFNSKFLRKVNLYGSAGIGLLIFRSYMSNSQGVILDKYGYKRIAGNPYGLSKDTPEYEFTIPLTIGISLPVSKHVHLFHEIKSSYFRTDKLDSKIANHYDKFFLFDFGLSFCL